MGGKEGPGGGQGEEGFSEGVAVRPWAHSSPVRPLESRPTADTAQARGEDPVCRPGDLGAVGSCLTHLARVELCIGVREASELPGAAVEVDIAGPKGGEEAQMVIHWETQVRIRGAAQPRFLALHPATFGPETSPQFLAHAWDAAPVNV